jgi:hypothetical protein
MQPKAAAWFVLDAVKNSMVILLSKADHTCRVGVVITGDSPSGSPTNSYDLIVTAAKSGILAYDREFST